VENPYHFYDLQRNQSLWEDEHGIESHQQADANDTATGTGE
jgi:hypothetical protein